MLAFARRMWRDKYKSLIIYSLVAFAFLWMFVALFPSIQQQADQYDQIMQAFPTELLGAINIDPSIMSFGELEPYIATEYMSFVWPILAIIFIVSVANYISIRDIDKGAIETLASLPVSRLRIFAERYSAGLMMIIVFTIISVLGTVLLTWAYGVDYELNNFITTTIGASFFAWAVYSLVVLISVIFSDKGKANMASGGILLLMYVLAVIANLSDDLQNLRYASFFYYFNGTDMLVKDVYPEHTLLILGGFALVATVAAALHFNRRDLSV